MCRLYYLFFVSCNTYGCNEPTAYRYRGYGVHQQQHQATSTQSRILSGCAALHDFQHFQLAGYVGRMRRGGLLLLLRRRWMMRQSWEMRMMMMVIA